jgi:hypothetical protein
MYHDVVSGEAGFLWKNREPGGLVIVDCSDTGSAHGLAIGF